MQILETHMDIGGVTLEVAQIPSALCNKSSKKSVPTIVFLHEGLGCVAMWRDFPAQLCAATGYAGLVYSRQGYGSSTPVPDVRGTGRLKPDYMHREAWKVLPALLSNLNIRSPVLLGHSDGGTIALLHASQFPVAGCIAMAPHLFVQDVSIRSIEAARQAYVQTDLPNNLRSKLARFHADADGAFWQWNDVWLSEAFRSFNIEAECAQITCPVLAIQGYDDPYGTMEQIDALKKRFDDQNPVMSAPDMRRQLLKLEHCGHSPHKDQTQKVTQAVVDWLGQLRSAN